MNEKLKFNFKAIIIGAIALMVLNLIKYGFSPRGITSICCTTLGSIGIPGLAYFSKLDYFKKSIIMNWGIAFSSLLYAVLVGESSNTFYIFFIILAFASTHFDSKITLYTAIPMGIVSFIVAILVPAAIGGEGTSIMSALTRVSFFFVSISVTIKATNNGATINKQAISSLSKLEETIDKSEQLAIDLNETVIESNKSVIDIISQVDNIEHSTNNMNNALTEITQGISNVNLSIDIVQSYVNENSTVSTNLSHQYEHVTSIVKESVDNICKTKHTIFDLNSVVDEAVNVSDDLLSEMYEINNILTEINEIANQTNLLSLNASIEAARAGEYGKGFAVVAEEIRKLSDQSTQASNNIKSIITSLNEKVKNVFNKIESGAKASKQSYTEMDHMTSLLEEINESTRTVEKEIDTENSIMNNISTEFGSIVKEMKNLYEFSEKNLSMLSDIQKSIEVQSNSVKALDKKMTYVSTIADNIVT